MEIMINGIETDKALKNDEQPFLKDKINHPALNTLPKSHAGQAKKKFRRIVSH